MTKNDIKIVKSYAQTTPLYRAMSSSAPAEPLEQDTTASGCPYGGQCQNDNGYCGQYGTDGCPSIERKTWGAVETRYKGYRFRSRLEARWAVYFDALGMKWEYEKEGYDLGSAGWYLPDFWLPEGEVWAEVKPTAFTQDEIGKARRLGNLTGSGVLMLVGVPDYTSYWYYDPKYGQTYDAMVCWFKNEKGRLYVSFGSDELVDLHDYGYECLVEPGVVASRSARFEHGEKGRY